MTEEQRKKNNRTIMIVTIILALLLVGFLVASGVYDFMETFWYPTGISLILFCYWLLSDVAAVRMLNLFEGKNEMQIRSYIISALLGLFAYAGIVYWVMTMENMTGAMVYVACTVIKRKYRKDYEEEPGADTDEEEEIDELPHAPAASLISQTESADADLQETGTAAEVSEADLENE